MARDHQPARSGEPAAGAAVAQEPAPVPARPERKPKEKAIPYWIGLIRNPWFEFITLAGLDVSLVTHKPTWDSNANQWVKVPQRGRILTVTAAQVEKLIEHAKRKIVRPSIPAKIIDGNADLEPDDRDFPVSKIVYAVPYASQIRDHDAPDPQAIDFEIVVDPDVESDLKAAKDAPHQKTP